MVAGDVVNLKENANNLDIVTAKGEYLGRVEPRHGQRLARLIRGGKNIRRPSSARRTKRSPLLSAKHIRTPARAVSSSFPTRGIEAARPDISDRVIRRELDRKMP